MSRSDGNRANRNGNVLPQWGSRHDAGSIRMLPNGQLTHGMNDEPTRNLIRDLCSANGIAAPVTEIQWALALRVYRADGFEGVIRSLWLAESPSPVGPTGVPGSDGPVGGSPAATPPPLTAQERRIEELVMNPEARTTPAPEPVRQWRPRTFQSMRYISTPRSSRSNDLFAAFYGNDEMQRQILGDYVRQEPVNPFAPFVSSPRRERASEAPPPTPAQEPQYVTQPTPGPPLFAVDSMTPLPASPTSAELWRPGVDYAPSSSADMNDAEDADDGEVVDTGGIIPPRTAGIEETLRARYREGELRLAAEYTSYGGDAKMRLQRVRVVQFAEEFVQAYRDAFRWSETWVEFETLPHGLRLLVLMKIAHSLRPRRIAVCQLPCLADEAMRVLMLINETPHLAPVIVRSDDVRSIELDDPSDDTNETPGPETA
jgi:hypothetical protein